MHEEDASGPDPADLEVARRVYGALALPVLTVAALVRLKRQIATGWLGEGHDHLVERNRLEGKNGTR